VKAIPEIKLPLIIDYLLPGRLLYPLSFIRNIIFFIICLFWLPNVVLFIEGDPRLGNYLLSSFTMSVTLFVLYIFFKVLVREYFIGSIVKKNKEIRHNHSKYSKKGTLTYDLDAIENIIIEKLGSKNENIIYLVEHSGKKHVIIEKFYMIAGTSEIERFLSKLSELTEWPVQEIGEKRT